METTLTDIDLGILLSQYDFQKLEVMGLWVSAYDALPSEMILLNIDYYHRKTTLKNVEGQELYYLKAKESLNSIYGMCAQNPVHDTISFDDALWSTEPGDPADGLDAYRRKGFLPYQWGVWCTAWARKALQWGIDAAGDRFVYADTDSVKYQGDVDWTPFNAERERRSKASGAYATDPKGVTHYMGVYEQEATADEFITLGAKRYAYTVGGDLHLTVAGVNKKKGAAELKRAGGLSAFQDGFAFHEGGRLNVAYHDDFPRGIYMYPAQYEMGLSKDYRELLQQLSDTHLWR